MFFLNQWGAKLMIDFLRVVGFTLCMKKILAGYKICKLQKCLARLEILEFSFINNCTFAFKVAQTKFLFFET